MGLEWRQGLHLQWQRKGYVSTLAAAPHTCFTLWAVSIIPPLHSLSGFLLATLIHQLRTTDLLSAGTRPTYSRYIFKELIVILPARTTI
jgi:hypothetical protein